jgi:hypothetical protein
LADPTKIDTQTLIVVPPLPLDPKNPDLTANFYALPYDVYTNPKYLVEPEAGGIVRQMKKYGTALGYIPGEAGIGIGSMCYLVNLRSLNTK